MLGARGGCVALKLAWSAGSRAAFGSLPVTSQADIDAAQRDIDHLFGAEHAPAEQQPNVGQAGCMMGAPQQPGAHQQTEVDAAKSAATAATPQELQLSHVGSDGRATMVDVANVRTPFSPA